MFIKDSDFTKTEIALANKLKKAGYDEYWTPKVGDWIYWEKHSVGQVSVITRVHTIRFEDKMEGVSEISNVIYLNDHEDPLLSSCDYVWLPVLHQCINLIEKKGRSQVSLTTYGYKVECFLIPDIVISTGQGTTLLEAMYQSMLGDDGGCNHA